ncbi:MULTISPECIES: S26 family signal peptidase [Micromonospora]|uniref:S26 family signal peptidase n=1 Tax=Micromonospora TaxID=1873 RepID=UPI00081FDA69|nr:MULTISPECIES: S26 family signal peptidase [Micromonospora]WTI24114.1 S26 family signal peptidase [Micromonospora zamorensis]SCG45115.1 signal peptidase I [Micromonospora zamorensis]
MLGWLAVAAVFAVATAALIWARRHLLLVAVVGRSMEPTLRSGDRVLARRVPLARIRPGDVVVVVAPAEMTAGRPTRPDATGTPGLLIKRAYAVPGDPVPVDRVPLLRRGGEQVVPAGRLVVLGDNPSQSYDSRECGYIPEPDVLGVVVRPRPRAD